METILMTKKGAEVKSFGQVVIDNKPYHIVKVLPTFHPTKEFLYGMVLISDAQLDLESEDQNIEVVVESSKKRSKKQHSRKTK
jgi:hypothetical protein